MTTETLEDLREYRETIRSFTAGITSEPGAGLDRGAWQRLAVELGAAGVLVPEDNGGAGSSLTVAMQVLGELATGASALPYLTGAILAPTALLACPESDLRSRYLEGIAGGEILTSVAVDDVSSRPRKQIGVTATKEGSTWRLDGTVDVVLDAATADTLLVVADLGGSTGLFAVGTGEIALTPLQTLDLTRSAASVMLRSVPAEILSDKFGGGRSYLFDVACAALSIEMAEAGGAALVMAVDYAGVRSQFGTLIGAQQLVQKLCADMFTVVTSARSISATAVAALSSDSPEAPRLAAVAKAYTSARMPAVGESNIQVHGGIGFTWEHPAHIFLRRLRADAQLFGDAKFHRRRIARDLGLVIR